MCAFWQHILSRTGRIKADGLVIKTNNGIIWIKKNSPRQKLS
ncbi:hypothetical protein ASZ90_007212 [hydrocarbon metagenome]|uniref:Uncharacterized protein n=1 Tax=hydrocarbon metagenome TaxID=938273 RepID=A0A0W8FRQ0_9ZZZZ